MNLAWHIARKDLFRLRFVLALWAMVITGHVAFAALQSSLDPASSTLLYVPAVVFGAVFLPAFGLGLGMGVLRDDPLADTDAFWVTRPISGAQLLAAKILVFAALACLPAVVCLPWWIAGGYGPSRIAEAAWHLARWNASFLSLTVAIAALSASIGRFVMGTLATGLIFLLLALAQSRFATVNPDGSALRFAEWSRFMAMAWWAATVLVLLNQFLSRRTARSVMIAALVTMIAFASSLTLTPRKPLPPDSGAVVAPRLEAVLSPAVGAVSLREGVRVKVVEATPDFVRGYVVVITEIAPDFTFPEWLKAPPNPPPPARRESYFLVHRHDGRVLRAASVKRDDRLVAATFRHSRRELVFTAPREWQGDPGFNFATWIADTALVKISAAADLAAPPRELLPTDLSSP